MSKLLKISIIFTILFSLHICYSNAETTNLYNDVENETTSNTSTNTLSDNTVDNTVSDNDVNTANDATDSLEEDEPNEEDFSEITNPNARTSSSETTNANAAHVNTISSISEANLGLNNILCIILIAIGVLMILLAIAILIRLKK